MVSSARSVTSELQLYQQIVPAFIPHFIQVSKDEQKQRHLLEQANIKAINDADKRKANTHRMGMIIAGCIFAMLIALTAFALWKDRPWITGVSVLGTIVSVVSTFGPQHKDKDK